MQEHPTEPIYKWLYLFIGLAVAVNLSGLFVTVMGPDGALYASIARHMVQYDNFADLFVQGKDWLDKPHFPFWITAIFFKIFGVNTWAYKLPGVIFMLIGALYTYKLAKALYSKQVALWAVLILLTSQHVIICTMDVRAEPYLTGLIIASVYHFYQSLQKKWLLHLLLASLFAACAVMTKGIFALIPIGGAVGGELLIKKNWKMVFNFRWLLAVVFIFIFILPELWTLYTQFDLHPEKVVFGRQQVSGLKFFFWDSQFGRFFNTGPIKKAKGDPSFFLHTILWAYLPWCLVLYAAFFQFFRKHLGEVKRAEWFTVTGSLLTFLVFSVSKFQLPFYITIVFPFFSIICAQYLCSLQLQSTVKRLRIIQAVIGVMMVIVVALLQYFFRPDFISVWLLIFLMAIIILFFIVSRRAELGWYKILFQCCTAVFFVNVYFNLAYYPQLLKYQSDSEAAFWINSHNPSNLPVVQTRLGFGYGLDFYVNAPIFFAAAEEVNMPASKPYLLFADKEVIDRYVAEGRPLKRLKSFENFRITRLNGKFLNHETRSTVISVTEVVLIN